MRPMHAWELYDDAIWHADRFRAERLWPPLQYFAASTGLMAVTGSARRVLALQRARAEARRLVTHNAGHERRWGRTTKVDTLPAERTAGGRRARRVRGGACARCDRAELFRHLRGRVLARGGAYSATRTPVCSGPNTNPSARRGELTGYSISRYTCYIDTDSIGLGGYTSVCRGRLAIAATCAPTPAQRASYDAALNECRL